MNEQDGRGAFAFGDDVWPGMAKLVEECGEVIQVAGKLMMTHGSPAHWTGNLRELLLDEVADVEAAIVFLSRHNMTDTERRDMCRRVTAKVAKFEQWHEDFDADPPPPIAQPPVRS